MYAHLRAKAFSAAAAGPYTGRPHISQYKTDISQYKTDISQYKTDGGRRPRYGHRPLPLRYGTRMHAVCILQEGRGEGP